MHIQEKIGSARSREPDFGDNIRAGTAQQQSQADHQRLPDEFPERPTGARGAEYHVAHRTGTDLLRDAVACDQYDQQRNRQLYGRSGPHSRCRGQRHQLL